MNKEPTLDPHGALEFPCRYPVKAMTHARDQALDQVLTVMVENDMRPDRDSVRLRASRNGRYQSITVEVEADSRARLEALYRELRALDIVVMTL